MSIYLDKIGILCYFLSVSKQRETSTGPSNSTTIKGETIASVVKRHNEREQMNVLLGQQAATLMLVETVFTRHGFAFDALKPDEEATFDLGAGYDLVCSQSVQVPDSELGIEIEDALCVVSVHILFEEDVRSTKIECAVETEGNRWLKDNYKCHEDPSKEAVAHDLFALLNEALPKGEKPGLLTVREALAAIDILALHANSLRS